MGVIRAEYDGTAFVPVDPVDLPAGTLVDVCVPAVSLRPTAAEDAEWRAIRSEIESQPPYFRTVDDAIDASRSRH